MDQYLGIVHYVVDKCQYLSIAQYVVDMGAYIQIWQKGKTPSLGLVMYWAKQMYLGIQEIVDFRDGNNSYSTIYKIQTQLDIECVYSRNKDSGNAKI